MKKIVLFLSAMCFILVGCKDDKKKMDTEEVVEEVDNDMGEEVMGKTISFNLESRSGSQATGTVTFTEKNGMIAMEANLKGLEPGMHAIHIHEKADCSAADGTSSGGHWNPTFEPHGKWGASEGYHRGDIGNFQADDSGQGTISMETDQWCIGCDDEQKNIMGKAIIVHKGSDDFTSQPSGAAGARVSCGGIIE